jgi:hypothetical protein
MITRGSAMQFLTSVDTWFLIIAVIVLAAFSGWCLKYLFDGIKKSISDLGLTFEKSAEKMTRMFEELYNYKNSHETRLTALETRCDMQHGIPYPGGRRPYDPIVTPEIPHERHEHTI